MADIQKTIEIIFTSKNETNQVFQNVASGLNEFEDSINKVVGPLNSLSNLVLGVTATVTGLGAALLGFSLNNAIQAEAALLDLQKVLSESEGDASQYSDQILELSNFFGIAATDVTQAVAIFRQSGQDISDSLFLTEEALKAVNITELSVEEATRLLSLSLNGFQLEASAAADILDKVNEVGQRTNASTEELLKGFQILAPTANQANLSIDETIGV